MSHCFEICHYQQNVPQHYYHLDTLVILIFLGNATNAVSRLTSISSFGFDDWSWLTNRLTEKDTTQRKLSFIQWKLLGSNQFRPYSSDKLLRSNSNSCNLYVFMSLGCFLPLCGWGLSGRIVTCVSFNKTSAKRGCMLVAAYSTACWISFNEYRMLVPDWFLKNRNFVILRP